MQLLDNTFDGRVLALSSDRGDLRGREWAPHSPDLNPLDFFTWGYMKSKVYRPCPTAMDTLKLRIEEEVNRIPSDMIRRAQVSVSKRAHLYVQNNGGYFEK